MDEILLAEESTAAIDQGAAAVPTRWASRGLYVGGAGAANWMATVQEPGYPLRDLDAYALRAHRHAALDGRRFATLVSLGPGDGTADVDLLGALARGAGSDARSVVYVPVDLSRTLLERAIDAAIPHAVRVVGLQCDFEGSPEFLDENLGQHAIPPVLFALLGGTVGNLDEGEAKLLSAFRQRMREGDAFLLDVPLAGPAWSAEDDPRLGPKGYTAAFRRFLGLAGVSDDGFVERVALEHRPDEPTGAELITVSQRATGRPLLNFRRYRWERILSWFSRQGFEVAFARSSLQSDSDRFGMGVVLLTPA